ncbi:uracil-DNA glycosylase family protein [Ulvibacterium sp.]|uniref:uracil-DNA glycosylase family protein n=1 Tax=Ulvibacterium sp. TaxID=2665914 RepID=UPI003BAC9D66
MFLHTHPYQPFLFPEATKLIVGTLPPPRFTMRDLKKGDVDFCYGSRDGQLWPILDRIFKLDLKFETSEEAVRQRMDFLRDKKIGICDIVESAEREKIDASDLGMSNIKLRNLVGHLKELPKVDMLLFTGGNSKNGPEYFFRRHLKTFNLELNLVSAEIPRIHSFTLPHTQRTIKTVSLTAPSGAANRAVGSLEAYKKKKRENPDFNTLDFRILQYKAFF